MSSAAQYDVTPPGWFKSSYSSSVASCVETFFDTDEIGIRDSKRPHTGSDAALGLAANEQQWAAFLGHIHA